MYTAVIESSENRVFKLIIYQNQELIHSMHIKVILVDVVILLCVIIFQCEV